MERTSTTSENAQIDANVKKIDRLDRKRKKLRKTVETLLEKLNELNKNTQGEYNSLKTDEVPLVQEIVEELSNIGIINDDKTWEKINNITISELVEALKEVIALLDPIFNVRGRVANEVRQVA